uniref:AlNc14C213G8965 protein n=1 Tax=Albugo laibachii Nc14 TaxID=890382 RepID=F0WRG2_9STRA|nr:AlNc14C213G8965 [Albugo laibachii Nc14]|eukprot:CCA23925.1 AlNc14C213G8965 [Albugo laibachii Nc14]
MCWISGIQPDKGLLSTFLPDLDVESALLYLCAACAVFDTAFVRPKFTKYEFDTESLRLLYKNVALSTPSRESGQYTPSYSNLLALILEHIIIIVNHNRKRMRLLKQEMCILAVLGAFPALGRVAFHDYMEFIPIPKDP